MRQIIHGHARTGQRSWEYIAWQGMLSRCLNPGHKSYPDYGGRGIKVCARWLNSFEAFFSDMGPKPRPDATVDRKDGDGDYTPKNCKWSTKKEQARNRYDNRWVTARGKTQLLVDWSAELGIPLPTLETRARLGWSDDDIVNRPYKPQMDDATAKKIARDYATGKYTLKQLTFRYEVPFSTVQAITSGRNHSEATGLKYRSEKNKRKYIKLERTPELRRKVAKMVKEGLSYRAIAEELGVSRTVAINLCAEANS